MTKYVRHILPALALAILFTAFAGEASAQGILREILKRMDNNNKALVSLKSDIKMAKYDSVLKETDTSSGTLNYLPGRTEKDIYVRIDWTSPVVEQLAIAKGKYKLFRPGLKQMIVGTVDNAKKDSKAGGALAFMTMSKAQLAANYDVKYIAEETVGGGINTWHLKLTPLNKATYKEADLWVDTNGMPVQARVMEKNNDTTTILLSGVQRNATIKASLFDIQAPSGTKVIQG